MNDNASCIMTIITAAFACGILKILLSNIGSKSMGTLLCGVYLTVSILNVVKQVDLSKLLDSFQINQTDAKCYTYEGERYASITMQEIIKRNCEAYVMEKANGMEITVEVVIADGDLPVPERSYISGQISPYEKALLSEILEKDLGINREDQMWSG